jgi:hypothetical protein
MIAAKRPGYIWKRMAEKEAKSMTLVTTVMKKSREVLVNARMSSATDYLHLKRDGEGESDVSFIGRGRRFKAV